MTSSNHVANVQTIVHFFPHSFQHVWFLGSEHYLRVRRSSSYAQWCQKSPTRKKDTGCVRRPGGPKKHHLVACSGAADTTIRNHIVEEFTYFHFQCRD
ncbi:hypothetical protein AVEN_49610-1 [Araneus ventricosus]|uniref:Uncharacterized protein n=1 Tax=Araneus ventricosus TaxID=182803 RepID=A0A4Y2SD83_ARAVE|nr:hypothetical protein AVEN_49610-1 [Araneus ventricosus]